MKDYKTSSLNTHRKSRLVFTTYCYNNKIYQGYLIHSILVLNRPKDNK